MRVRGYNSKALPFSPTFVMQEFAGEMSSEKARLTKRLAQAARWQKRLDQLSDPRILDKIQKLLVTFQDICTKEHITFVPKKDSWEGHYSAKYSKDDVTLDMYIDMTVTPEKLWANFYSRGKTGSPFRIYIGKEIRVTNKILAFLLKS